MATALDEPGIPARPGPNETTRSTPGDLDQGRPAWYCSERWRRDLNPRRGHPLTRFRGVLLRPLGHTTAEKGTRPGASLSRRYALAGSPAMSTHIGAKPGEIAPRVLLPGDPLRAKWIAETFLEDATCYSTVRNMYGFTGRYQGGPVSVQGSGMGMPSASIYYHELLVDYGAKTLIRVGTCGALTE